MSASVPRDIPSQMTDLRELLGAKAEKGWDAAWEKDVTPWDVGKSQPPLREVVESGELDLPRSGRALVPGCGRGYDAIYIATTLGLETLGTDISLAANKAAQEYLQSLGGNINVKYEVADFFTMDSDVQFDLVYDYTFFVAIPPTRRGEWGEQMTRLVKPGGFLIALVFPILPYTDVGPPFYVRPEHYDEVLGDKWERVLDRVPENSLETHIGKDRIVVWKRL